MATIHSQVFTKAHVIAKSLRDNKGFEYRAAFSIALRKVWAEYKAGGQIVMVSAVESKPSFTVRIPKARAEILAKAENFFRRELGLPADQYPVTIKAAKSFSRGTLGYFEHNSKTISMRNSKCLTKTLETMAHELVHAQQVHENRLAAPEMRVRMWNGERMSLASIAYRRRPWEVEAFERQGELAAKFLETL